MPSIHFLTSHPIKKVTFLVFVCAPFQSSSHHICFSLHTPCQLSQPRTSTAIYQVWIDAVADLSAWPILDVTKILFVKALQMSLNVSCAITVIADNDLATTRLKKDSPCRIACYSCRLVTLFMTQRQIRWVCVNFGVGLQSQPKSLNLWEWRWKLRFAFFTSDLPQSLSLP